MIKFRGKNFTCDECPICENLEHRLTVAKKVGQEPQLEYCGCDKIQTYFYVGGFCGDAFADEVTKKEVNPRKTGRAYRRLMKKQKKERRMRIIEMGRYNPTVGYVDYDFFDGKWVPIGKYIKYPNNSNNQRFFKRYSNRMVRKKELSPKGNGYRKHFDYWWNIY